jgi:hypothetical protein
MTIEFLYLAFLLLGAILAMVTGLIRRMTHPSELCDGVVVPSHEHWAFSSTPLADLVILFITFFGMVGLVLHGFTRMALGLEVALAVGAGLVASVVLRRLLCSWPGPTAQVPEDTIEGARVVRAIPPGGFGQVEMQVGERTVKMAARSFAAVPLEEGTTVEITDNRESVVVVSPVDQ